MNSKILLKFLLPTILYERNFPVKFLLNKMTVIIKRMIYLDWKFTHEPFNSLEPSTEFQERFVPISINVKKEEEEEQASVPISKSGKEFFD